MLFSATTQLAIALMIEVNFLTVVRQLQCRLINVQQVHAASIFKTEQEAICALERW